jgi:hypothetical protein
VVNAADAALAKAKAQNPANPAAVQAAQDQLDIAKAQRADTLADPDTSQQESALEAAAEALSINRVDARPTIVIAGQTFTVIGIIDHVERRSDLRTQGRRHRADHRIARSSSAAGRFPCGEALAHEGSRVYRGDADRDLRDRSARQEALRWRTTRLTAIAIRVGNKLQERPRTTI